MCSCDMRWDCWRALLVGEVVWCESMSVHLTTENLRQLEAADGYDRMVCVYRAPCHGREHVLQQQVTRRKWFYKWLGYYNIISLPKTDLWIISRLCKQISICVGKVGGLFCTHLSNVLAKDTDTHLIGLIAVYLFVWCVRRVAARFKVIKCLHPLGIIFRWII